MLLETLVASGRTSATTQVFYGTCKISTSQVGGRPMWPLRLVIQHLPCPYILITFVVRVVTRFHRGY
jgi:hypothetical protein